MKILVISPYIPWPLYSGACVRIFNVIKQLSLAGHEVHLLVRQNTPYLNAGPELPRFCAHISSYHVPPIKRSSLLLRSLFSRKIYPALSVQSEDFKNVLETLLSKEQFRA